MQLARNKQLDQFFVRNLNKDPGGWAFEDQTFDAVVCCVRCVRCIFALQPKWQ